MSTVTLDLTGLQEGEIRAATDEVCVTRTGDGVFAFQRSCPHANADLINGYVEDGQIRCAWHNVPFDLQSGCGPCETLPPIRVFPVTRLHGNLYELDLRS